MSPRPRWTFITNHGAVLAVVGRHGKITARNIAGQLGISERAVRRIIRDLEHEGYVVKTREGRTNRYEVNADLPLRRPDGKDISVGELLNILALRP